MNAIQKSSTVGIPVKYFASTVSVNSPEMRRALPAKPSPELSARKSPNAVPRVFEKRMAVQ
jgi:hypothetical protein